MIIECITSHHSKHTPIVMHKHKNGRRKFLRHSTSVVMCAQYILHAGNRYSLYVCAFFKYLVNANHLSSVWKSFITLSQHIFGGELRVITFGLCWIKCNVMICFSSQLWSSYVDAVCSRKRLWNGCILITQTHLRSHAIGASYSIYTHMSSLDYELISNRLLSILFTVKKTEKTKQETQGQST